MIIKDGKEYRNIQEQVLKNKIDIERLFQAGGVLDEFGIKVIDQCDTEEEFEARYPEDGSAFAALEYGDAVAVGTDSPYELHIKTRANYDHPNDYWFYIGSFPAPGPQGEQGEQGIQGPIGPTGADGTSISSITSTLAQAQADGNLYNLIITLDDGTTQTVQYKALKGPKGDAGSVESVNNQTPDANGNVYLSAASIEVQDVFGETLTVKQAFGNLKTNKQDKLTAGQNITIVDNVISATGGGGTGAVDSVNGKTGTVVLTASDIDATNAQSIQSNLERLDERIDDLTTDEIIVGESEETGYEGDTMTQVIARLSERIDAKQDDITPGTGLYFGDDVELNIDLNTIQHKLTAGSNITIVDNVISASGGSADTVVYNNETYYFWKTVNHLQYGNIKWYFTINGEGQDTVIKFYNPAHALTETFTVASKTDLDNKEPKITSSHHINGQYVDIGVKTAYQWTEDFTNVLIDPNKSGQANPYYNLAAFVKGVMTNGGILQDSQGKAYINAATTSDIAAKTNTYKPITPSTLDYAVKEGLTNNALTWTNTEITAARNKLKINVVNELPASPDENTIYFVVGE